MSQKRRTEGSSHTRACSMPHRRVFQVQARRCLGGTGRVCVGRLGLGVGHTLPWAVKGRPCRQRVYLSCSLSPQGTLDPHPPTTSPLRPVLTGRAALTNPHALIAIRQLSPDHLMMGLKRVFERYCLWHHGTNKVRACARALSWAAANATLSLTARNTHTHTHMHARTHTRTHARTHAHKQTHNARSAAGCDGQGAVREDHAGRAVCTRDGAAQLERGGPHLHALAAGCGGACACARNMLCLIDACSRPCATCVGWQVCIVPRNTTPSHQAPPPLHSLPYPPAAEDAELCAVPDQPEARGGRAAPVPERGDGGHRPHQQPAGRVMAAALL